MTTKIVTWEGLTKDDFVMLLAERDALKQQLATLQVDYANVRKELIIEQAALMALNDGLKSGNILAERRGRERGLEEAIKTVDALRHPDGMTELETAWNNALVDAMQTIRALKDRPNG